MSHSAFKITAIYVSVSNLTILASISKSHDTVEYTELKTCMQQDKEKMRVGVRGSSDTNAVVCIYARTHSNSVKYNIFEL